MREFAVVGTRVQWTGGQTVSMGTVTDRTKAGLYRPSPDHRGYVLVLWDGGMRRWCNRLRLA